jgi:ribosome-associated protein
MPVSGSRQLALACARACDEKKATDIVVLDVQKLTFVTRYFVICTTAHPRQARAVGEAVADVARALGEPVLGREGFGDGEWVLVDLSDVVVHVFSADRRAFYDIESAWADARRVRWVSGKRAPAPS